jgi:hypothetical protein
MISLFDLFEEERPVEKIEQTKNYVVEDYKNPPKKFISKYRRKTIIDKDGTRHLLTIAFLNKLGRKVTGHKSIMTSLWHPKTEEN